MSRQCTVCSSPIREEIDLMLFGGKSCAETARASGVSVDAIARHAKNHLRHSQLNGGAVSGLQQLQAECDALASAAGNDVRAQIMILREKLRLLELSSRAHVQQSVMGEGEFVRVGSVEFYDAIVRDAERLGLKCTETKPSNHERTEGAHAS